jgi:hypothetical protein
VGKDSLGKKEEQTMKPNIRTILTLAIERGIDWGWSRAHKYTDTPDESRIKESIETEIWNEIDEVFDFEIKPEVLL